MTKKGLKISARRYLAGLVVYGLGMVIFTQTNYYRGFIGRDTLFVLKTLFTIYVFAGWPFQLLNIDSRDHKPSLLLKSVPLFLSAFSSFCFSFLPKSKVSRVEIDKKTKTTLLFFLVKLFYVPIMLNFFLSNGRGVIQIIAARLTAHNLAFDFRTGYTDIFTIIFAIDTLYFAVGYLVEHPKLKNVVKSVEPTILGWAVALASYPPFNSISTGYLNWYSSDYFYFPDYYIDMTLKIVAVACLALYLWATLSLGWKSSNLTNRGIVTNGAYKHLRHPAYTGKLIVWWITALQHFSVGMILSMIAWTILYGMRAITEERHLIADPDYKKYVAKTRFRFIPGLI